MKAKISNDLMNRVKSAAKNGSIIASDLLVAIKNHRDLAEENDKTANYFDSLRVFTHYDGRTGVRIVVSCCRKDIHNPNFPDYGNTQAPYFPENRSKITLKDFACLFKAIREKEYSEEEWRFFDSAARVGQTVKIRVSDKMKDFERAYLAGNYINITEGSTSTLHGSCMRHEDTARNAADFYANFAGAKILIAETESGDVCARAILWPAVYCYALNQEVSFIDRVYTAFDGFLLKRMYDAAAEAGALFRKTHNDYNHKEEFTFLRDFDTDGDNWQKGYELYTHMELNVPVVKMHKRGAPYIDTMSYLYYNEDNFCFTLRNDVDDHEDIRVASLAHTGGWGEKTYNICAFCGKTISTPYLTCDECVSCIKEDTFFGDAIVGKVVKYKGVKIPAQLLKNGKPIQSFAAYITLNKLTNSNFPF